MTDRSCLLSGPNERLSQHPRDYRLNADPARRMREDRAGRRPFGAAPGTVEWELAWCWEEIAQLRATLALIQDTLRGAPR